MNAHRSSSHSAPLSGVVVVVLLDYWRQHQAWGWFRLASGSLGVKTHPGLQFAKVMGSGHEGGFTLRPSATHQGVVAVFDHLRGAIDFVQHPYVTEARKRARESWVGVMRIDSVRGHWDGVEWAHTRSDQCELEGGVTMSAHADRLAVLTRASIRPAKAMAFWRHAPTAQADLHLAQGCEIAMGLGEAPLVRQCTFSLWEKPSDMVRFAHDGAHRSAIESANRNGFFNESLFVRMKLLAMNGVWKGRELQHQPGSLEVALV